MLFANLLAEDVILLPQIRNHLLGLPVQQVCQNRQDANPGSLHRRGDSSPVMNLIQDWISESVSSPFLQRSVCRVRFEAFQVPRGMNFPWANIIPGSSDSHWAYPFFLHQEAFSGYADLLLGAGLATRGPADLLDDVFGRTHFPAPSRATKPNYGAEIVDFKRFPTPRKPLETLP